MHNGSIRYGVLFTRSIGDADAHAHLGLVATPEIRRGTLDPMRDKFIVLATDGVWDFLDEDAVARMVEESDDDAQAAVDAIVSTYVCRVHPLCAKSLIQHPAGSIAALTA